MCVAKFLVLVTCHLLCFALGSALMIYCIIFVYLGRLLEHDTPLALG